MKRSFAVGALAVLVALGVLLGVLLSIPGRKGALPSAPATPKTPVENVPPSPTAKTARPPQTMTFQSDGLATAVMQAVRRVAPTGRVKVAVQKRGDARWVCILADGQQRYFELDRGLTPDQFPWLAAQRFRPAPSPVSRGTMSVYRSYAKKAMDYRAERGDRIVILLCPSVEWPDLNLTWPAPETAPD